MVGYETVKSTLFAVALDGSVARFSGRGYGHGVGMSQWGAKGMAEQGYKAEKILEYYYPGTTLGWLASPKRRRIPGRNSRIGKCGSGDRG
jgi:stage II sporulation protein D